MNIQMDPWPHIIEDNFFDQQLFNDMKTELLMYAKTNMSNLQPFTKIEDFSSLPLTNKCLSSKPITEDMLKTFDDYRPYTELTVRQQVIICLGQYINRIHDEIPSKIFSVVTYVAAVGGRGTRLFDDDHNLIKEVEWEENRTLLFPGITNKTWHDYYSLPNSIRITVNTFLEQH